jgi:hypothetical protein
MGLFGSSGNYQRGLDKEAADTLKKYGSSRYRRHEASA